MTAPTQAPSTFISSEIGLVWQRPKGEYYLAHHADEVARLAAQHEVFLQSMGRLVIAPVDLTRSNLRILDTGTADGRWLLDLHASLPSTLGHQYIGIDCLSKLFSTNLPSQITLKEKRIDATWPEEWQGSFDYVHQRLVLPGSEHMTHEETVTNLCQLVRPGGWIELIEQDHDTPNSGGMAKAEQVVREIFTNAGCGYDYPHKLREFLEKAGMEDIKVEIFDVPIGVLNPDPEMAAKSTWQVRSALEGFMPTARGIKCSLPKEELEDMPAFTERELKRVGGYQRLFIAYGRCPSTFT
ncbi:hypothetical protein N7517_007413 [Penicillium concentricum]|uniref:Methyltransferase domain-containing protein n=1 Tax=Penicillium concentricum TaxID=293559 RepID=A0A9W9SC44_9EURO|nr:uncharacterized protein N7517_007413 [Penicillium concentricum]KAJ5375407.1 hypothetical protein N7517_007413 [Penicillium concentricum]